MVYYRLYTLRAADGPFIGADEISATDDVEAVRLARKKADGHAMELWCGKRKVKTFSESEPEIA